MNHNKNYTILINENQINNKQVIMGSTDSRIQCYLLYQVKTMGRCSRAYCRVTYSKTLIYNEFKLQNYKEWQSCFLDGRMTLCKNM
jgi:hypothetical protein